MGIDINTKKGVVNKNHIGTGRELSHLKKRLNFAKIRCFDVQ